jgi:hypothetical protein
VDYAKDGYLGQYESEDIADAVLWDGDPQLLWKSLGDAGFLDRSDEPLSVTDTVIRFDWRLHDWDDYAGKLIERRKTDAYRKRSERLGLPLNDIRETSAGHPSEGARTVPNITKHNTTQPDHVDVAANAATPSPDAESESDARQVFEHYRVRIQPKARLLDEARKKIQTRLQRWTTGQLVTAIDNFAADTWQMDHNAHRGAAWFFVSDTRIEQYVNLEPKSSAPMPIGGTEGHHTSDFRRAMDEAQRAVQVGTARWEGAHATA